jgi:hypothetical protein
MHCIEMPVDLRSVIHAHVPEQVEPVLANLLRLSNDSLYDLGEPLTQALQDFRRFFLGEEKAAS